MAVRAHRRVEAGFSLIELVLAMGLLAVALTAVYGLQAASLDLHAEARFATRGTQLLRARMARVLSLPTLTEGTESGRFDEGDGVNTDWRWEQRIEDLPDRPGLYRVRVRVFLEGAAGAGVRDLSVETLACRRTP